MHNPGERETADGARRREKRELNIGTINNLGYGRPAAAPKNENRIVFAPSRRNQAAGVKINPLGFSPVLKLYIHTYIYMYVCIYSAQSENPGERRMAKKSGAMANRERVCYRRVTICF